MRWLGRSAPSHGLQNCERWPMAGAQRAAAARAGFMGVLRWVDYVPNSTREICVLPRGYDCCTSEGRETAGEPARCG